MVERPGADAERLRADQHRGEAAAGGRADQRRLGRHLRGQLRGYVREAVGGPTGGHWHILVETPGDYEFTLRRWPEQTKAALGDKYEPSAKSPNNRPKGKTQTIGFPKIAVAKIDIAGVKAAAKADPKAGGATVMAKLPAGTTKLKAWFSDADGNDLCGAFFVTVRKK